MTCNDDYEIADMEWLPGQWISNGQYSQIVQSSYEGGIWHPELELEAKSRKFILG